jgi:adenylylsulfate kinase-like enzyme
MLGKSVCILFSGKAGTGKTTSAMYLNEVAQSRGLILLWLRLLLA